MTKQEVINLCLEFEGAFEDYPFDLVTDAPGSWTVMRHKSNKRGFAHIYSAGGQPIINLKLPPNEGDALRQSFKDINPAYHMNKEHWNGINPNGDVPLDLLKALIEKSYELTKPKK